MDASVGDDRVHHTDAHPMAYQQMTLEQRMTRDFGWLVAVQFPQDSNLDSTGGPRLGFVRQRLDLAPALRADLASRWQPWSAGRLDEVRADLASRWQPRSAG